MWPSRPGSTRRPSDTTHRFLENSFAGIKHANLHLVPQGLAADPSHGQMCAKLFFNRATVHSKYPFTLAPFPQLLNSQFPSLNPETAKMEADSHPRLGDLEACITDCTSALALQPDYRCQATKHLTPPHSEPNQGIRPNK